MHNFPFQWWSCLKICSSSIYLMTFIKNFLILLWVIFKLGNNKNKVHNGRKKSPFPITFFQKYNYFLSSINEEAWEYKHSNVRNNNKTMVIIYILIMSYRMFFSRNTCEEISHALQYPQLWLPYSIDLNILLLLPPQQEVWGHCYSSNTCLDRALFNPDIHHTSYHILNYLSVMGNNRRGRS